MNDLKKIITGSLDEVDIYLTEVTSKQFIEDVKELLKIQADKSAINEAIKRLQELI